MNWTTAFSVFVAICIIAIVIAAIYPIRDIIAWRARKRAEALFDPQLDGPSGVRLVYEDGVEQHVKVRYESTDDEGIRHWSIADELRPGVYISRVHIARFPGQTALGMPETIIPSFVRGDES